MKRKEEIYDCAGLVERVREVGFLPLLVSGIPGYSAEEMVAEDCRYVVFDDGGWDWPLWKWKGQAVADGGCVYGKFFGGKAGFVSREWWPDFCNYRRWKYGMPDNDSIEGTILSVLREQGSMITRELRAECGFGGSGMRSKFDGYVTRLQMGCRVVTEDFVYPRDKHGKEYGWGWALLSTAEALYGEEDCRKDCSGEESYSRMMALMKKILPKATDKELSRLLG
jgi:hypothetical protein